MRICKLIEAFMLLPPSTSIVRIVVILVAAVSKTKRVIITISMNVMNETLSNFE